MQRNDKLVVLFHAVNVPNQDVTKWPGLDGCRVVERRYLGVPLQPGLTHLDYSANVLVCVLALVRGDVDLRLGKPRFVDGVDKQKGKLDGFRRSSVVLVADNITTDVLSAAMDSGGTLCIDDLRKIDDQ